MKGSVKLPVFIDDARKYVNTTQLRAKYLGASYEAEYCQWQTLHGLGSLMETASLIITPNAYLEGKLIASYPPDPIGDFDVTRATTATRVNSAGLVELVPYNLNTNSENFTTSWGNDGTSTTTNNFTTAPNGTMTAAKVVSNIANGYAYKSLPVPSGTYTLSYYVKASAPTTMSIAFNDVGGNGYIGSYGIAVTTEWQRISLTANLVGSNLYIDYSQLQLGVDYYIWGAQLVEGSTAKDYQKTETRLNIPRLDYSNGTCPSLLVEPQRTNILKYSEDFENIYWYEEPGNSVTSNTTISPSGIQNADTFTAVGGSEMNIHNVATFPLTTGTYTYSVYLKNNGTNLIEVYLYQIGPGFVARGEINFSAGTFTASVGTGTIQELDNGWYRVTLTNSVTAGDFTTGVYTTSTTGTRSVFVWGAQLEAGNYSTSYIPTTSASVTRNADVISKTGISSLIGQTEGVWYLDLYASAQNIDGGAFATWLVAGDSSNNFQIYNVGTTLYWFARNTGGVLIDQTANQTIAAGERYKIAFAYKAGEYALYINGVQKRTNTNANVPAVSQFNLSAAGYGASPVMVKNEYNAVALWKTRLTNTQLAQLTTI
jgi:hypothetical protein